ncbi:MULTISPECIES: hypothetical protein [unclassified Thioalkalivibrio]|uniref:hypothetical protein n=1 Tax=unclassified Thioalkalivibrio TaxID=2621013 RepID=UPI0003A55F5B|nr:MULTISPECIES: hypothetical protein [unclassified Thioalkalivibrio]
MRDLHPRQRLNLDHVIESHPAVHWFLLKETDAEVLFDPFMVRAPEKGRGRFKFEDGTGALHWRKTHIDFAHPNQDSELRWVRAEYPQQMVYTDPEEAENLHTLLLNAFPLGLSVDSLHEKAVRCLRPIQKEGGSLPIGKAEIPIPLKRMLTGDRELCLLGKDWIDQFPEQGVDLERHLALGLEMDPFVTRVYSGKDQVSPDLAPSFRPANLKDRAPLSLSGLEASLEKPTITFGRLAQPWFEGVMVHMRHRALAEEVAGQPHRSRARPRL